MKPKPAIADERDISPSPRPMVEHLELPRPLRLVRTTAWRIIESAGLPLAAYVVGTWLGGRDTGLLAGLAATWSLAVIRKISCGSVPSLLTISAVMVSVQTALVLATGELWIYLLQFPVANLCMCVLFARTARGPNPLVARLATELIALRQPATYHPGLQRFFQGATWLWAGKFLLLTAVFGVTMWTEPTSTFLMLCTATSVTFTAASAGATTVWFMSVLRRHSLRLRFAPV